MGKNTMRNSVNNAMRQRNLIEHFKEREVDFDDWWFNKNGYQITEKLYGKEVILNADRINPNKNSINVYSDELEKFARENNLHLK